MLAYNLARRLDQGVATIDTVICTGDVFGGIAAEEHDEAFELRFKISELNIYRRLVTPVIALKGEEESGE